MPSRSASEPSQKKCVLWYKTGPQTQYYGGVWDIETEGDEIMLAGSLAYKHDNSLWYELHYYFDKRKPDRYAPKDNLHRAFKELSIRKSNDFEHTKKCLVILRNELTTIESKTRKSLKSYHGENTTWL